MGTPSGTSTIQTADVAVDMDMETWWDFMYMDTWWEFLPAPPYRKANGGEGEVQTCRKTNEEEPGRASNGRTSWTVSNS